MPSQLRLPFEECLAVEHLQVREDNPQIPSWSRQLARRRRRQPVDSPTLLAGRVSPPSLLLPATTLVGKTSGVTHCRKHFHLWAAVVVFSITLDQESEWLSVTLAFHREFLSLLVAAQCGSLGTVTLTVSRT
jgi:hypothetical protein